MPLEPTEALIARRLDALVAKHPELADLRQHIPGDLSVTDRFFVEYAASPLRGTLKSLLVRALLADPSLFPDHVARPSQPVLCRLFDWMGRLGLLDGAGHSRDAMPKSAFVLFREQRCSVEEFTAKVALAPWWSMRCGLGPRHPALAHLDEAALAPLARVVAKRTLSASEALGMASETGDRSPPRTRWYFSTGAPPVDLRNALVYLAQVLKDRYGGRVQNRLPAALTLRWGLPRVSIPHALIFADLGSLAAHGCIDWRKLENDWLRLREATQPEPSAELLRLGDPDIKEALAAHLSRSLMTRENALRHRQMLDHSLKHGMFDTGLAFNVRRLLSLRTFSSFAPYYQAIDAGRLLPLAARRWAPVGPTPPWCFALLRATACAAEFRDLGNVRSYLTSLDIDLDDRAEVWRALPSVARFSLGAAEPRPASTPRRAAHARPAAMVARPGTLPRLSEIAQLGAPRVYVLAPTYTGPIPADGHLFVHAAHAAGFTPPKGADIVGASPLDWGVDPLSDAATILAGNGWVDPLVLA